MKLQASTYTARDEALALEEFHARGWTDGLPVVIPTQERVESLLIAGGQDPDIVLGSIGPANGEATVEKVAINAVMAGCLPEHFPVVLAAVRAVCDEQMDIGEMQATTHSLGPAIIVNGPAREACGPIASGWGALGPGHRANASIGRALRLALINIGGGRPGLSDMAVLGQPGKFTMCLAEAEEDSPFAPLHVQHGFGREESAVTLVGVETPHSVIAVTEADDPEAPERLLRVLAASIANAGSNNTYFGRGAVLVIVNPLHAAVLAGAGMTREDVCRRLAELAVTPKGTLGQFAPMRPYRPDEADELQPALRGPEDIVLVVAGGEGIYSAVCNSWGAGRYGGVPVSRGIEMEFACELPGVAAAE
ncbi:MAG: hypothetical protein U5Q44_12495 [Dehalococcoidia bacterium]|nr:hypothetical protein [Dehalococcoidia bacterium]